MIKNISDFPGANETERITKGIEYLKKNPGCTLSFTAGTYRIDSAIDFSGAGNATIDGNGATVLFNPQSGAFTVSGGKDITIRNLTLEPAKNTFLCGKILSADTLGMNLMFDEADRESAADILPGTEMLVFSHNEERFTKSIVSGKIDFSEDGSVRMRGDYPPALSADKICIPFKEEKTPAIHIDNSENITIETINIFGGVRGVICTDSKDIFMNRVMVVPAPGEGMSTSDAGGIFEKCRGALKIKNCVFEGQGCDALKLNCENTEISGSTMRNNFGSAVVITAMNALIEGCFFDGGVLAAVNAVTDKNSSLTIQNNRIIRRGEKYRFPAENDAGGIHVSGHERRSRDVLQAAVRPHRRAQRKNVI